MTAFKRRHGSVNEKCSFPGQLTDLGDVIHG